MIVRNRIVQDLLTLSHEIGCEERGLAVLAEGNTSARLGKDTFLVKASGTSLGTLKKSDIVECRLSALLALLDRQNVSDKEVDAALLASRVDSKAKKPSLEAAFHAYLLSLPDVQFAAHAHATHVNSILCSPRAREFASNRMTSDEAGSCGIHFVFVPYIEPGLQLACAICTETAAFIKERRCQPRVILLQNHGIITLGHTWQSVLAAMWMAEKAAKIFIGAATLGGPVFLSETDSRRFADRSDEVYRRRIQKI